MKRRSGLQVGAERLMGMSAKLAFLLFSATYIAMVVIMIVAAPLPQMILPWEAFFFYESGWRVLQGLAPHADFYSALEPLTCLIPALGMAITGGSLSSLTWGMVLSSVPLAAAAWLLLSKRLTPVFCLLVSVYIVGMWLMPFPLRFGFRCLTYGGLYNREGYALVIFLAFLLLLPRRERPEMNRADLVASGILLGLMLGIKASFLGIGALFVSFYLLHRGEHLSRCGWIGAGFALVVFPLLAYIRFDIPAVLGDYAVMGLARGPGTLGSCLDVVFRDVPVPAFFNLVALAVEIRMLYLVGGLSEPVATQRAFPFLRGTSDWKGMLLSRGLEFMVFVGGQVMALLSNAPEGGGADIPLLDVYGLIQAQRLLPYLWRGVTVRARRPMIMASLLGAGYPALSTYSLFLLGFGFCFLTSYPRLGDSYFIPMEVRSGDHQEVLRVGKHGYNVDFVAAFKDGKALLARHVDVRQARIASLDATNLFPFAFRGKSAPAMPTFWQDGRNISIHSYPPAKEVFRDCDCVLIPTSGVVPYTTVDMLRVYSDTLQKQFVLVEGTRYWSLYVRKSLVHG